MAEKLALPFYDADNFHPPGNVDKMSSGKPLNDEDRQPWLEILAKQIKKWNSEDGAVLACSALKESYRKLLITTSNDVQFVYLEGDKDTILTRMRARKDHYMPPELLDSQFEALEIPGDAISVSFDNKPERIVKQILDHLS